MYEKKFISEAVRRSTSSEVDRRKLFTMLGVAGAGAAVATVAGGATAANATTGVDDAAILNFALNLEYLEAEFYLHAVTGEGLNGSDTEGTGRRGGVSGAHKVPFKNPVVAKYAREIAKDEREHVRFLRKALGGSAVARPEIQLNQAFSAAAAAAGLIKPGQKFDAFANDESFLIGAFLFEDVGVTAYKGAAGLIANKTYLEAAAGILAVEAYHAGAVRSTLYNYAYNGHDYAYGVIDKISAARDSLDGTTDLDQGIGNRSTANVVPTDSNSIAFSRSAGQVLNIVYLNPGTVTKGGFYPYGVNGGINTSGH